MIETLKGPLWYEATEAGKLAGETRAGLVRFRNSFFYGAALAIRSRLEKMRKPPEDEPATPPTATSTALVEVKGAMVKQYMEEHHPKLGEHRQSNRVDAFAQAKGYVAGQKIELRQGIESDRTNAVEGSRLALPGPGVQP